VVRVTAALSTRRVAEALALPLAGEVHAERRLRTTVDSGRPGLLRRRGPLSLLCDRLLDGWTRDDRTRTGVAAA